jgi:peptidyl-prolyl cis-trans isomerase SurA
MLIYSGLIEARIVERIVAVVNDEIILLTELEERSKVFIAQLEGSGSSLFDKAQRKKILYQVLNLMIDEHLMLQEASKMRIEVKSKEITKAIERIMKQHNLGPKEFEEALSSQGYSMATYRQEIRRQIIRMKLISTKVRTRVTITEEDLRRFYNQNVREIRQKDRFKLSYIFVKIPKNSSQTQIKALKKKAENLTTRAKKGEDFTKLTQESSQGSTQLESGDLGYVKLGELHPNIDKILPQMKKGEVQGPIYTPKGFYIIKLLEKESTEVLPFEKIKEKLREQLFERELKRQEKIWLKEIRKAAYIEIRL